MFIGHFALGFAAKRAAPRVSLAALCAAAQTADLLWPILVAVGAEQVRIDPGNTAVTPLEFVSYPYSHSLLFLCIWGAVFAAAYSRTSLLIFGLVVSHWVLDFVTHRPDMPLYPGSPRFGLGLWSSVAATVAVELPMYAAGLWIYARATRPRDAKGKWGFWTLAAFLTIVYIANIAGPPPPSVGALWVSAIVGGLILLVWIWWVDHHRDAFVS